MEKIEQFMNLKNIKIFQDEKKFKFNLDSILLANFVCTHYKRGKIIDLATGTLPIPLYLNFYLKQKIWAVELQKDICELGNKTIEINHLEDFIFLNQADIKNIKNDYELHSFDVVVCNPPYFNLFNSKKVSKEESKVLARHNLTLKIEDVLCAARFLLKNQGKLFLIYRTENIQPLLSLLHDYNLEPKVIRFIHSRVEEKSKLFLIEARLNGKSGCIIENPLIVYKNKMEYTEEILEIFGGV